MATTTTQNSSHYRDEFVTKCLPFFVQGFDAIYNTTLSRCKKRRMLLRQFQEALESIPLWNSRIIATEHQRFLRDSNCMWLDDLIKGAFLETATNIARSQGMAVDVTLEIPNGVDFVHGCYINIAREVWKKPQLLYHEFDTVDKLRNRDEFEKMVARCLIDSFKKQLPMEKILASYLKKQDAEKSGGGATSDGDDHEDFDDDDGEPSEDHRGANDDGDEIEGTTSGGESTGGGDSCATEEATVVGGELQEERREILTGKDALVKKMAGVSVVDKKDAVSDDDNSRVTCVVKVGGEHRAEEHDEMKKEGEEARQALAVGVEMDSIGEGGKDGQSGSTDEEEIWGEVEQVEQGGGGVEEVEHYEPFDGVEEHKKGGREENGEEEKGAEATDPPSCFFSASVRPPLDHEGIEDKDDRNDEKGEVEVAADADAVEDAHPPFFVTPTKPVSLDRGASSEQESFVSDEDSGNSRLREVTEGSEATTDTVDKQDDENDVQVEGKGGLYDGIVDAPDEDQEISVTIYPEEDDVVLAAVPSSATTGEASEMRAARRGTARREATQAKITRILGPGITVTDFKDRKRRDRLRKYMLLNSYIHRY